VKRGKGGDSRKHSWAPLSERQVALIAQALGIRPDPMDACVRCYVAKKGALMLPPEGDRFARLHPAYAGCPGQEPARVLIPESPEIVAGWPQANIDEHIRSIRAAIAVGVYANPAEAERFLRLLWCAHLVAAEERVSVTSDRARERAAYDDQAVRLRDRRAAFMVRVQREAELAGAQRSVR